MKPRALTLLLAAALGWAAIAPAHAACTAGTTLDNVAETTPSGEFAALGDGFVLHMKTRLVWKRCAEGQTWDGTTCSGTAWPFDWGGALNRSVGAVDGGSTQWRVPNRKELESIVEFCGYGPAINKSIFPATPADRFWTSTTFPAEPNRAWDVYFSDGYVGASTKPTTQYLRLVRSVASGDLPLQQTITIGATPNLLVGTTVTLTATASSGLPVVFSALNAGVCAVSGNSVTALTSGICSVEARQTGDDFFVEAVQTFDLPVDKHAQTITFGAPPSLAVNGTATVSVTSSSGLPVNLSSATPTACSVAGSVVTGVASGTCTLMASQPGNEIYLPAPTATLNLTVTGPVVTDPGSTTPPPEIGYSMRHKAGWHLLGNSLNMPLEVSKVFSDRKVVESVWKWNAKDQRWAFYTPQFNAQALSAYTKSRDLDVLAIIPPGEGYWLKLKQDYDFGEQRGEAVNLSLADLSDGWHLVTLGKSMKPSELHALMTTPAAASAGAAPPAVQTPTSFESLWSWDNAKGKMLFYAPALKAKGPEAVKAYLDANGYLDFDTEQKQLGEGRGFWIRIKK